MAQILAAKSADVASGAMFAVTVEHVDLLLFRSADGTVHALEDRCSHADVRLSDGSFDGQETVECPAHGAQFDVCSGKNLCMPAVSPVKRFPCSEQDGKIVVEL